MMLKDANKESMADDSPQDWRVAAPKDYRAPKKLCTEILQIRVQWPFYEFLCVLK